jgi:hypothetical protein
MLGVTIPYVSTMLQPLSGRCSMSHYVATPLKQELSVTLCAATPMQDSVTRYVLSFQCTSSVTLCSVMPMRELCHSTFCHSNAGAQWHYVLSFQCRDSVSHYVLSFQCRSWVTHYVMSLKCRSSVTQSLKCSSCSMLYYLQSSYYD